MCEVTQHSMWSLSLSCRVSMSLQTKYTQRVLVDIVRHGVLPEVDLLRFSRALRGRDFLGLDEETSVARPLLPSARETLLDLLKDTCINGSHGVELLGHTCPIHFWRFRF